MVDFQIKEKYDFEDLINITRVLRSPGGCAWDMAQTHTSVRNDLLEEAYEVADAIDTVDDKALCEELGDLLFQVMFHAQISNEEKKFDISDVIDGICQKLVFRHPHVFGEGKADTPDEVIVAWDKLKMQEKSQQTFTQTLESVPHAFPALMRAAKVQKRAAKAGFDWQDASGAWDKLSEESGEVKAAVESGNTELVAEELGDLLFSVVNISRFLNVNAEEALERATDKFIRRFSGVEKLATERGINMPETSLEVLDSLWDEVKQSDSKLSL